MGPRVNILEMQSHFKAEASRLRAAKVLCGVTRRAERTQSCQTLDAYRVYKLPKFVTFHGMLTTNALAKFTSMTCGSIRRSAQSIPMTRT